MFSMNMKLLQVVESLLHWLLFGLCGTHWKYGPPHCNYQAFSYLIIDVGGPSLLHVLLPLEGGLKL